MAVVEVPKTKSNPQAAFVPAPWQAGAVWALLMFIVVGSAPHKDFGDHFIRRTIHVSLLCYFAATVVMLFMRPMDWGGTRAMRLARTCWSLAWLTFVIHVHVAFKYYHNWDHDHAVEHTRQVSGVGWGIYVSHAFTLLWTLDVLAWWVRPSWYAGRSPWIDRCLHGFMAFIIFNGTVVYEKGPIVPIGAVMFVILGALAVRKFLALRRVSAIPASSASP